MTQLDLDTIKPLVKEALHEELELFYSRITADIFSFVEKLIIELHRKIDVLDTRISKLENKFESSLEKINIDIAIMKTDIKKISEVLASQQIDLTIALNYRKTLIDHEERITEIEKKKVN